MEYGYGIVYIKGNLFCCYINLLFIVGIGRNNGVILIFGNIFFLKGW